MKYCMSTRTISGFGQPSLHILNITICRCSCRAALHARVHCNRVQSVFYSHGDIKGIFQISKVVDERLGVGFIFVYTRQILFAI